MKRRVRLVLRLFGLLLLGSCHGHHVARFPLAAPLWQDPDRNPVPRRPAEYFSALYADGLEQCLLHPVIDPLALPLQQEAANVNAVDEVPDSSWFVNRMPLRPLSPEQVARGSCRDADIEGLRGPFRVTLSKDEGATPGFFAEAPGGQRYLIKLDDPDNQPRRASAADVITSRIYHALGYYAPCNQVLFLRPADIAIANDASYRDSRGLRKPLTRANFDKVLSQGLRLRDGRLRAMASRLLEGKPLGPHSARGLRPDDPNDIIPHQDRRELRAERLLAAWLGHFDAREQNSLDTWVEQDGRHFVRHYQMDFGDSFGGEWKGDDRLNRNIGYNYYVDIGQMLTDFVSFGALRRPWYGPLPRPGGATFGYYGWQDFRPSQWKPIIPHAAFQRMTWRDALWMVRRIVSLSDEQLRAAVREGKLEPSEETYLLTALIERRKRIAAEYLGRYVPLADPELQATGNVLHLCFADLSIRHAGADPTCLFYGVRLLAGERLERVLGTVLLRPDPRRPDRTCARLHLDGLRPADLAPPGAPDAHPLRYAVLEISVERPRVETGQLRLHLYDLGPQRGLVLVGLERR